MLRSANSDSGSWVVTESSCLTGLLQVIPALGTIIFPLSFVFILSSPFFSSCFHPSSLLSHLSSFLSSLFSSFPPQYFSSFFHPSSFLSHLSSFLSSHVSSLSHFSSLADSSLPLSSARSSLLSCASLLSHFSSYHSSSGGSTSWSSLKRSKAAVRLASSWQQHTSRHMSSTPAKLAPSSKNTNTPSFSDSSESTLWGRFFFLSLGTRTGHKKSKHTAPC